MLDSLYDLPPTLAGLLIGVPLCGFALICLFAMRRFVVPRLRLEPEDSEFTGAMLQGVVVMYSLVLSLVAVGAWETHSEASTIVSREATAVAVLYRDVSSYPEPMRSQAQADLRDYLEYVIRDAWPRQARGEAPRGGATFVDRLQARLGAFEPATANQQIHHAEALRAFNHVVEARRLRLDAVLARLPEQLWLLIVAGALISIASAFFFRVSDARLQATLVLMLTTFIAMVIFVVFALDRPFRGQLGVSPEAYQLVYEQLSER